MEDKVNVFFTKYNGIGLNFDGAYGNQCMDLIEFYNKEVVGGNRMGGNAIDIWTTYNKALYTRIENAPTNFPNMGDICIFNIGKYGHVSIANRADMLSLVSFDQNWPIEGYTDSSGNFIGTGKCHFQAHNYINDKVLGWLRPTNQYLTDTQKLQKIKDIYSQPISNDDKVNKTIPFLV